MAHDELLPDNAAVGHDVPGPELAAFAGRAGSGTRRTLHQRDGAAAAETPVAGSATGGSGARGDSPRGGLRDFVRGLGACGCSMAVHAILLVVLGLLGLDESIQAEVQNLIATATEQPRPEDEPVEIELNEEIDAVTDRTLAMYNAAPSFGAEGGPSATGSPRLDQRLVELVEARELVIDAPTIGIPDSLGLIESVPDGDVKGEPRDIVGDYQQAMDRLAQEIVWMLDQGPVLLIWLFDQSNSMKDDQREIRDRIGNVYNQLGIVGTENSDALLTSITSYGEAFLPHTPRPTSNRESIRAAIDSIPIDHSGREMMSQAVGQAIRSHRRFLSPRRRMALVVVTDESGQASDNDRFLEASIAEAKAAKCKVYVLGRESMFGYPFAYVRWRHPQTQRVHWLEINRGPETGFPEQLQTDGFRRRTDAFSSGFGPYEQSRLARETNGIFFMLPTTEDKLAGAQNRYRYDLDSMRPFLPDMRSRIEVLADRDKYPLRSVIWQVIRDLNPHDEQARRVVELERTFPLAIAEFTKTARENQIKAQLLLKYMAEAENVLRQGMDLREQEPSPRWQANYDLILAQLVAYQARIHEYGVGLEMFLRDYPAQTPLRRDKLVLHAWHLRPRPEILSADSQPYIRRATQMLSRVVEDYRGTPWSARAEWELRRGFGVHLRPYYDQPWKQVENPSPLPKL